MIKTLTRHGNSYAVVIDKPILELLNIAPETPLEISTDGNSILIAPAPDPAKAAKLKQARKGMIKKYGEAFRKLAK
ncbi:MAG: AbrB/MazE/SpoVT family DNA-binding domain-containing protein [Planctomycetota bacterium]|jgi:antitoxin component of MazEF toxin-antitoxin module|nr:AbrB/MazE/SpoVT family DNA-binding domain-containing protein [Planctomycetota bacterium]